MTEIVLTRYLHFIGILGLAGTLVTQNVLLKRNHTKREILLLSKVDSAYGLFSIIVLAGGLLLWFGVGKPSEFYSSNWIFITKVSLFGTIGLLSIYPTVFFIRNRSKTAETLEDQVSIPKLIQVFVRLELVILITIPLLAALMAIGIGTG